MAARYFRALTLALFLAVMLGGAAMLNPFGSPPGTVMDDYYIANGQEQTGSNNIVTSVVFDYRGMDTLGEGTVLFSAAMGVLLLLGRGSSEKE